MRTPPRPVVVAAFAVSASLIVAGCAPAPARRASEPGLDPKFGQYSFEERGRLVSLIVGVRPAMMSVSGEFVPIEVAMINRGLGELNLSRESFVLVDEAGNRYPAAGPKEVAARYTGDPLRDRRLGELEGIVTNLYAQYTRAPSACGARFDRPLECDRASLPQFGYLVDFLYFPVPADGVRGRRFELFVSSADLPDPVFVRFAVPDPGGRR